MNERIKAELRELNDQVVGLTSDEHQTLTDALVLIDSMEKGLSLQAKILNTEITKADDTVREAEAARDEALKAAKFWHERFGEAMQRAIKAEGSVSES